MTDVTTTPAATQVHVPLQDLALAPENIRFKTPADEGVPQLAETIAAANVVIPLAIRPGRKPFSCCWSRVGSRRASPSSASSSRRRRPRRPRRC